MKKNENSVKLEKISSETLEIVLDYVYTGVANVTADNVLDLLDAAEFAQLEGNFYFL